MEQPNSKLLEQFEETLKSYPDYFKDLQVSNMQLAECLKNAFTDINPALEALKESFKQPVTNIPSGSVKQLSPTHKELHKDFFKPSTGLDTNPVLNHKLWIESILEVLSPEQIRAAHAIYDRKVSTNNLVPVSDRESKNVNRKKTDK